MAEAFPRSRRNNLRLPQAGTADTPSIPARLDPLPPLRLLSTQIPQCNKREQQCAQTQMQRVRKIGGRRRRAEDEGHGHPAMQQGN